MDMLELFNKGGFMMWPILVLLVFGAVGGIQKFVMVSFLPPSHGIEKIDRFRLIIQFKEAAAGMR